MLAQLPAAAASKGAPRRCGQDARAGRTAGGGLGMKRDEMPVLMEPGAGVCAAASSTQQAAESASSKADARRLGIVARLLRGCRTEGVDVWVSLGSFLDSAARSEACLPALLTRLSAQTALRNRSDALRRQHTPFPSRRSSAPQCEHPAAAWFIVSVRARTPPTPRAMSHASFAAHDTGDASSHQPGAGDAAPSLAAAAAAMAPPPAPPWGDAEALVGRRVRREYVKEDGSGDLALFDGTVTATRHTHTQRHGQVWAVDFDDGDRDELSWQELQPALLDAHETAAPRARAPAPRAPRRKHASSSANVSVRYFACRICHKQTR